MKVKENMLDELEREGFQIIYTGNDYKPKKGHKDYCYQIPITYLEGGLRIRAKERDLIALGTNELLFELPLNKKVIDLYTKGFFED